MTPSTKISLPLSKYTLRGEILKIMKKNQPKYSIGFWVKAVYSTFNNWLKENGRFDSSDILNTLKNCSERNLVLLLSYLKDGNNINVINKEWKRMVNMHEYNVKWYWSRQNDYWNNRRNNRNGWADDDELILEMEYLFY